MSTRRRRLNLSGAWPDVELAGLLPTPSMHQPVSTNLLRDAASAAEAHKCVEGVLASTESSDNVQKLIESARKSFTSNDHDFTARSLARSGPHGVESPAAALLSNLLERDRGLFDAQAPEAPPTVRPAPRRSKSNSAARKSAQKMRKPAAQPSARYEESTVGMGDLISPGQAAALQPGSTFWLQWDNPKDDRLHGTWFAASVSAELPYSSDDDKAAWEGYHIVQFETPQISLKADQAFDLVQYARLQRLRHVEGGSYAQQSSLTEQLSNKASAAASKRDRPTKRAKLLAPAAREQNPASAERRLRPIVDGILERARDSPAEQLSSSDSNTVVSTRDVNKLLADVLLLKSSVGEGVNVSRIGADSNHESLSVWGVTVDEWHTVMLVLDRFIKAGVERLAIDTSADCVSYTDAALIILHMATLTDRPKQLLISETIDTILQMVKRVLDCVVVTPYGPTGRTDKPGLKQQSTPSAEAPATALSAGKVKKAASKAASGLCEVFYRLAELCRRERLEDAMLCSLTSLGIGTLGIDGPDLVALQMSCIQLLCTIAKKHYEHRNLLFNELSNSLSKLSQSTKRSNRQFQVSSTLSVQMTSALLFNLLQSCVSITPGLESEETADAAFQTQWDKSRSDYDEARTEAKTFLSKIVKKCAVKRDDSDFRVLLERLIDDACSVLNLPAWPSAESIVRLLAAMMMTELRFSKTADSSYRGFLLDMLGNIACKVYQEVALCPSSTDSTAAIEDVEDQQTESRLLVLQHLSVSSEAAIPYHMNVWLAEDGTTTVAQEKLSHLYSRCSSAKVPPRHDTPLTQTRQLAKPRELLSMGSTLLENFLMLFQDANITLRSKAMKVLTSLMDVCESIFSEEHVKHAVKQNLFDHAISVREAAVDMVGRAMALSPAHTSSYLELILERVLDTGKSVRKRCVRILHELLCSQPTHPSAVKILIKLAGRADDEDSIREVVLGSFRDLWFNPELRTSETASEGPVVVLTLAQRVDQILEVLTRASASERVRFVSIFSALVGRSDRESDTRKHGHVAASASDEDIIELCGKMCDQVVEVLLTSEETEDGAVASQHTTTISQRTCCIMALYMFCKTGSDFLVGHITTLQPYLKLPSSASLDDNILVQYTATIIQECLPLARNLETAFKVELESDLLNILQSSLNPAVIQSCARCYCAVYQYALIDDSKLRRVLEKYYMQLKQGVDTLTLRHAQVGRAQPDSQAGKTSSALPKAIFVLGLLCRNYAFGDKTRSGASADTILDNVAHICVQCAGATFVEQFHSYAIQALGNMACRQPNLLLKEDVRTVIEAAMQASAPVKIKQHVLKALSAVLVNDERTHLKSSTITQSMNRKEDDKKLTFSDTADDSLTKSTETGLSGGLMQLYIHKLLALTHDNEQIVRREAVQLIGVILRQGLVHPMECVPSLVALEADRDKEVCNKVGRILNYLDEKHHSFLVLRSVEGVIASYAFQLKAFREARAIDSDSNASECKFAQVYSYLRGKRNERNQFTRSLLAKFDPESEGTDGKVDLKFLFYVASVLSSLPYGTKDEVVSFLEALSRAVNIQGEALNQELTKALAATDTNSAGQEISREAYHQLRPKRHKCHGATAVCMLILLKRYLQTCYGVTDSQLASYASGDTAHKVEKSAPRRNATCFEVAELSIEAAKESDEQLYARYTQLQGMLNDDDIDGELFIPPTSDKMSSVRNSDGSGGTPAARKGGGRAAGAKRSRKVSSKTKGKAKPKPKRRRKRLSDLSDSDDDEDDDDDSDYE